jgi:hypothetical protein
LPALQAPLELEGYPFKFARMSQSSYILKYIDFKEIRVTARVTPVFTVTLYGQKERFKAASPGHLVIPSRATSFDLVGWWLYP